jgi:hypothetical protein
MPIIGVRDTFDGGSGTLNGRTPELGHAGWPWVATVGGGDFNEMGGHVEISSATNSFLSRIYTVGDPRSPNYRVWADVQGLTGATMSVIARYTSSSNYYALDRSTSGQWELRKVVGGLSDVLASAFLAAGDFATTIELAVSGDRLVAFVGGAQVADVVNAQLTAAGQPGIVGSVGSVSGPSTGRVFGFEVVELQNPVKMAA